VRLEIERHVCAGRMTVCATVQSCTFSRRTNNALLKATGTGTGHAWLTRRVDLKNLTADRDEALDC